MLILNEKAGFPQPALPLFVTLLINILATQAKVTNGFGKFFDKELLGIGFDPLTPWIFGNYTSEITKSDFGTMLEVIGSRFQRMSTYRSEIVSNVKGKSSETTASWVAVSASNLNKKNGAVLLKLYIGIGNFVNTNTTLNGLKNILPSVRAANNNFPGTVAGIIIHNFCKLDNNERVAEVLESIKASKLLLIEDNFEIGIRTFQCDLLLNHSELFGRLDFVICFLGTDSNNLEESQAENVIQELVLLKSGFPASLKVTGEVGWCGVALTSSVKFWRELGKLAIKHNVRVDYFEAFDQHRKDVEMRGCGWWERTKFSEPLRTDDFREKIEIVGNQHTDGFSFTEIAAVTGAVVLIFVIPVSVAIIIILRKRKTQQKSEDNYITPLSGYELMPLPLPTKEMPSTSIHIKASEMLGAGEYGMVFKGTVTGRNDNFAVKVANVGGVKNLLSELKILLKMENHPNVVSLIAYCTKNIIQGQAMLVLDLCEKGNLADLLREINTNGRGSLSRIWNKQMMQWCLEIASGMEYISSINVVHGDLATRNILITGQDIAKITDFGLSRHLYDMESYLKATKEPIPVRWMALESLKSGIFSTRSDVWSYGVTVWEIFSFASVPYKGIPLKISNMVQHLESGMRLSQPELATDELFQVMTSCWHHDSNERPGFQGLIDILTQLQRRHQDYSNA